MRRLLHRFGVHRYERIATRGFTYIPTAVLVDRFCLHPGCDAMKTELWWQGRKL